jgi:hypothetical protein
VGGSSSRSGGGIDLESISFSIPPHDLKPTSGAVKPASGIMPHLRQRLNPDIHEEEVQQNDGKGQVDKSNISSPPDSEWGSNSVVSRPAAPSVSAFLPPTASVDRYFRTFISLALFLYLPFSSTVLTHLNCVDVGNGIRVVFVAPTIDCATNAYKAWMGGLIVLTITVVAGAPLALAYALYKHRHWINMQARMPEGAADGSASSFHRFHHRFGLLYEPYSAHHPLAYLYHVWVLLRRLIVVVIDVAFFSAPAWKYVAFTLWNAIVLHVHLHMRPYRERVHDYLETATLAALAILSLGLTPYADLLRVGDDPLPLVAQFLLAILVLPLTVGLSIKIAVNMVRRLVAICRGKKMKGGDESMQHIDKEWEMVHKDGMIEDEQDSQDDNQPIITTAQSTTL